MLSIKAGVQVGGLRPEMILAVMVAERIWSGFGVELVITSALDGKHSQTSLHYAGCAVDFRTNQMASDAIQEAARTLKEALGQDFDVIIEKDHVHVEFQPRGRA